MRRAAAVILLALLAAGLLVHPVSAAPRACANLLPTETFDVAAEARRDAYRIGQTAKIDVVVTDSITGLPQDDVRTGVFIKGRGDKWISAFGRTDEEGHVLLGGRLQPSHFEPEWAHVFAVAFETFVSPALCADRYGWSEYRKLFRITR